MRLPRCGSNRVFDSFSLIVFVHPHVPDPEDNEGQRNRHNPVYPEPVLYHIITSTRPPVKYAHGE